MPYTVSDLKTSVGKTLTGINLNNIEDVDGSLQKAARTVILNAGVSEAVARESINLYDGVFDYSVSSNMFGSAVIDLIPQGNSRNQLEKLSKYTGERFDRLKKLNTVNNLIAFKWDNGSPIARISAPRPKSKVRLDALNDTTGWTAAGSATGLAQDESDYYESPASLRFSMSGSSIGTLTKTLSSLDLSDYEDLGVVFLAVKIPDTTVLTNIALRLGSSDTVYDSLTVTQGFLGAWKSGKWLLVSFDMSGASSTGTPDWSAIDYVQVLITHTGALTNFRVGDMFIARPSPHELEYATTAIWKASGQNPAKTINGDSDEIILSDGAYLLLEDEAALTLADEQGVSNAKLSRLQSKLYGSGNDVGEYARYRAQNPSNRLKEVNVYSESSRRLQKIFRR